MPGSKTFSAYMNARVRGMKSELLSRVDIDSLWDKADLDAMSQFLVASPYEHEMAEALTRFSGADAVEDAVSRNLVNTFARLHQLSRGEHEALASAFLTRWDLVAVKSLLRARHHQLDASTAETSLFPAPSMPIAVMTELASQDTMESLIQGLAAWNSRLCSGLQEAMSAYQEARSLRVLEEALDRAYFVDNVRRLGTARDENSKFVLSLLRMEIDRINLRILFEPRPADTAPEDVLMRVLPRGTIHPDVLREIASAPSTERALGALEKTAYAAFGEGMASLSETGHFSRLERAFEQAFLGRLQRAAQHQGIGLAVLMHYAWLKYNEVMNLRMIARGLSVHLPKERIFEEVVYV